ncbi:hypothetical protein Ahy_B08g091107 [Arachis hypogaea]|uniref:Aminotransferase-like plant mobile domain-containing protein n=1 Tax=Arachis hypogaea TaxID=3818 RepID=A0A444Y1J6_ARAHY|nr:hypothetical protein Ahy_B08g091107 [Arachis hypogaea]
MECMRALPGCGVREEQIGRIDFSLGNQTVRFEGHKSNHSICVLPTTCRACLVPYSDCRGSCIKLTWLRDLKEHLQLIDENSIQSCVNEINHIRWRNWERGDRRYRYLSLAHFRESLDDLQEGQFVWVAYGIDRIDPDIILADIYMQSVVWSTTVSLVSFECIEWHATDRFRRQFGFVQEVPHQEWNLDKTYEKVLTSPKNFDWATAIIIHLGDVVDKQDAFERHRMVFTVGTSIASVATAWIGYSLRHFHDEKVEQRLESIEKAMKHKHNLEHSEIKDIVGPGGLSVPTCAAIAATTLIIGIESQLPPPPLPPLPPQEQPQSLVPYVPQTQFIQSYPIHQQYWRTPQFDTGDGASFSQLLGFMVADPDQSQSSHQPNLMMGRYSLDARHSCCTSSGTSGGLVSGDSSKSDGGQGIVNNEARTPDETGKCYNLRVDPPCRSANRFTPFVFKRVTKKCKSFVKDVKWAMRNMHGFQIQSSHERWLLKRMFVCECICHVCHFWSHSAVTLIFVSVWTNNFNRVKYRFRP